MVVSTLQRLKKHSPLPNLFLGLEMGNRNSFIRGYYPSSNSKEYQKNSPFHPSSTLDFVFGIHGDFIGLAILRLGDFKKRPGKSTASDGFRGRSWSDHLNLFISGKKVSRESFSKSFLKNYIYIHIIYYNIITLAFWLWNFLDSKIENGSTIYKRIIRTWKKSSHPNFGFPSSGVKLSLPQVDLITTFLSIICGTMWTMQKIQERNGCCQK